MVFPLYAIDDDAGLFDVIVETIDDKEVIYQMYYTKSKEEARKICILLNTTSEKWKYEDFVDIWADSENENYIWFKEFKEKYNLNFITARYILTGINRGLTQHEEDIEFRKNLP